MTLKPRKCGDSATPVQRSKPRNNRKKIMKKKHDPPPLPVPNALDPNRIAHIWIELTNQCNLSCTHCYANSSPSARDENPLRFHEYCEILRDAFTLGATSVQFIGGEPTINPLLETLIHEAREIGFDQIEVFSNLTNITDGLLDTADECGAGFATSVYSDVAEVHDSITCKPGSHAKTVASIRRIVKRSIPIRVGIITMERNSDRVTETLNYVRELGVSNVGSDRLRRIGRPAADEEVVVSELCGHCWEGNLCVDSSGSVSPCIMSKPWKVGSIREFSLLHLAGESCIAATRQRLSSEYASLAHDHTSLNSSKCSPEDRCGPGACKPQVGGPPGCYPQKACMPKLYPGHRTDLSCYPSN